MDGDRTDYYQRVINELPPFQKLMLDLDVAVTGIPATRCVRQYHHYPKTFEEWLVKSPGGNPEWYLSDSGYSRVVWSYETGNLFLTSNSTSKAKANWEQAMPQRKAVQDHCNAEITRMRELPECSAQMIVDTLLEMQYHQEPLPPKPQFEQPDDELEFHAKNPFSAYSYALERGHHPRLWDKVRGSVYEPLYRKRFNVGEAKRGPSMDKLKEHRVELDPSERNMVIRHKAVWHHGPGGKPSPAVWKAVIEGKTWYVCNTHRAAAVKPTLRGAIKAFEFIKTTS